MKYECTKCGVKGVRLWRQWNTPQDQLKPLCQLCSEYDQRTLYKPPSDQIGSMVPAAPSNLPDSDGILPECTIYHDYFQVPKPIVEWWKKLPSHDRKEGVVAEDADVLFIADLMEDVIVRSFEHCDWKNTQLACKAEDVVEMWRFLKRHGELP